jgi:hypothetical protein
MTIRTVAGFDWNHGNLEKCQKHGVEIAEIESAFRQTMAVFPDPPIPKEKIGLLALAKPPKVEAYLLPLPCALIATTF